MKRIRFDPDIVSTNPEYVKGAIIPQIGIVVALFILFFMWVYLK